MAATTDYDIANIRGGLEAGIHYIEGYDEFLSTTPLTDSDWAAGPYAGLRVEADITVWLAGSTKRSSLRADPSDYPRSRHSGSMIGFWDQIAQCKPTEPAVCKLSRRCEDRHSILCTFGNKMHCSHIASQYQSPNPSACIAIGTTVEIISTTVATEAVITGITIEAAV